MHEKFAAAFNAADLDSLVALYEADAVLAPQPNVTATGHDAIREAYRGFLAIQPRIEIETLAKFEVGDGLAMLHGRWTMSGIGPDGAAIHLEGRNTEVVRRQPDGQWLFVIDNPFTP